MSFNILYFVYCILQMFYTVGILWTTKEEFHCIAENMFLYCAYDNNHFKSWILNQYFEKKKNTWKLIWYKLQCQKLTHTLQKT